MFPRMETWGGWGVEHTPQDSAHGTKIAGVQKAFRECSQTYALIFVWSSVVPGAGPDDLWGFLPAQDVL